jgi:nucleoside-diphosphate-sugar epimerase
LESTLNKKARIKIHPRHPADMLTNHADVSKARQILDWEPQVPLEEGLLKLVDWYFTERAWVKNIRIE